MIRPIPLFRAARRGVKATFPIIVVLLAGAGVSTTAPAQEPPQAKPMLSPSKATPSNARERIKMLVERRQADEARTKILTLKGQPRALLIVKTGDGKAQLVRANAVSDEGNLIAAELAGGGKGVWQKEFVVERLDWPSKAEIDAGAVNVAELLDRYVAAANAYPDFKPELDAEAVPIKGAADLAEQRKAAIAAITALDYDPEHAYTVKELTALVAWGESIAADQSDISAEVDQILTPFRDHLKRLQAGQQRIDGDWFTPEKARFENLIRDLNNRPIAAPVLTRAQLLRGILVPLIAVSVALLAALFLLRDRRWRHLGIMLLACATGAVAACGWAMLERKEPSPSARVEVKDGALKVVHLLLASRGQGQNSATPVSLTAPELNAFAREYLKVGVPPPDASHILLRSAFSVELEPDRVLLFEQVLILGQPSTILYDLRPAADGQINLESVHIARLPAHEPLKTLLWESASAELLKVLGEGERGLKPRPAGKGVIEITVTPSPRTPSTPEQHTSQ